MLSLILDLARQVRGVLRPAYGGTGNSKGWGRGVVVACSNRTGSDLPLMTLVRRVTPGGPRVEPTDTDAETDVLGVVVGYFDPTGLLVEADAPHLSEVAVLKDGVTNVLIDADVDTGDYAYAAATDGQARGGASATTGAFGQFMGGGGTGQYAEVRVMPAAGGGGGGGMTDPTTTEGDLIYRTSGAPARLPISGAGEVLTSDGTDPGWAPLPDGAVYIEVACSNETGALTAGTSKVTFRMPCHTTLTEVRASLQTAQASGSIFTVDINEGGTTILSTKLTIDNTEKTSTTASTPAVISDSDLADDAEITVDIDQVGDGTAIGLKVVLIGTVA